MMRQEIHQDQETRPVLSKKGWALGLGVIGLLAGAVILPNLRGACACDTQIYVKMNMHTLQTMVETYAVDWQGQYPPSLKVLEEVATTPPNPYFKPLTNPYSKRKGLGEAYAEVGAAPAEGLVIYEAVGTKGYRIVGYRDEGKPIMDNQREVLVLSNS